MNRPSRAMIGWILYDWADTAFGTIVQTFIFAAYFTRAIAPDAATGSVYWGNTIGLAGLAAALLAPFLGAIADRSGRLKPWLLMCVLLMAGATLSLAFLPPGTDSLWSAMLLVAGGTIAAQCAMIFYNAFLPTLAAPERQGWLSGWGWGMGYVGGLLCLGLIWLLFLSDQPVFVFSGGSGMAVRLSCAVSAVWIILFTLPLLYLTPESPGHAVPLRLAIPAGLRQLKDTLRQSRQFTDIWRFLLASLCYRDGLAALFAMGGVFAAGMFGMNAQSLLLFGITLNVTGAVGAIAFAYIDPHIGSLRSIRWSLAGLMLAGAMALFAAQTALQFWIAGAIMGLFVGPVQASSRSYLAMVAPVEWRTQMFGLYTLAGRATAFIGPLLVGWLTWVSGDQRIGMGGLLALLLLGFVLLFSIRPARDRRAFIAD